MGLFGFFLCVFFVGVVSIVVVDLLLVFGIVVGGERRMCLGIGVEKLGLRFFIGKNMIVLMYFLVKIV